VIDPAGKVAGINDCAESQKGQLVSKNVHKTTYVHHTPHAQHQMLYEGNDTSEKAVVNAKLNMS
jgi:hypothetical protein